MRRDYSHDPDPAAAGLRARLATLESMIAQFDAATCKLVDGHYWDSSKTSPGRADVPIHHFLGDAQHCCMATEADWTREQAWTNCTTSLAADPEDLD